MEAVILISLSALFASLFALLVAIGSALRVQSVERGGSTEVGLRPGTRLDPDALVTFVGKSDLTSWLRGPTLIVVAKRTCPGCQDLVAAMNERSDELAQLRVLMIERGQGDVASLREMALFNARWVDDRGGRSKEVFRTNVSPHAFLIEHGEVQRQRSGGHAIQHLLDEGKANSAKAAVATPL